MKKFKTAINGFHKGSVDEQLKRLQSEHAQKKLILENELNDILSDILKLKQAVRLSKEGGQRDDAT